MALMFLMVLGTVIAANVKKGELDVIIKHTLNKTLIESKEKKEYFASWHLLQTEVRITVNILRKVHLWKYST